MAVDKKEPNKLVSPENREVITKEDFFKALSPNKESLSGLEGKSRSTTIPVDISQYQDAVRPGELFYGTPDILEDYAAQNQNRLNAFGNGLGRLVGKTFSNLGETAGFLAGIPNAAISGDITKAIDNDIVRFFEDFGKQIAEATPIYASKATQEAELFSPQYLFSRKFLLGDLIGEGGSFLASAWLTGFGAGKLAQVGAKSLGKSLARAIATGEADNLVGRTVAKTLYNLPKTTAMTVATYTESAFEARDTFVNNYNKFLEQGVDEDTAKELAVDAAKKTFALNMLTLPLSEYQYSSIFKKLGAYKSTINKIAGKVPFTSKVLRVSSGFVRSAGSESLQEGLQMAIQDVADLNAGKNKNILEDAKDVIDTFLTKFTDREYAEAMLAGGLLSSPFGIANTFKDIKNYSRTSDQIVGNINTFSDYFTKENKVDSAIKNAALFSIFEGYKNQAALDNNEELFNAYNDLQFANLAYEKISNNEFEKAISELDSLIKPVSEEGQIQDNVPVTTQEEVAKRKRDLIKYKELYDILAPYGINKDYFIKIAANNISENLVKNVQTRTKNVLKNVLEKGDNNEKFYNYEKLKAYKKAFNSINSLNLDEESKDIVSKYLENKIKENEETEVASLWSRDSFVIQDLLQNEILAEIQHALLLNKIKDISKNPRNYYDDLAEASKKKLKEDIEDLNESVESMTSDEVNNAIKNLPKQIPDKELNEDLNKTKEKLKTKKENLVNEDVDKNSRKEELRKILRQQGVTKTSESGQINTPPVGNEGEAKVTQTPKVEEERQPLIDEDAVTEKVEIKNISSSIKGTVVSDDLGDIFGLPPISNPTFFLEGENDNPEKDNKQIVLQGNATFAFNSTRIIEGKEILEKSLDLNILDSDKFLPGERIRLYIDTSSPYYNENQGYEDIVIGIKRSKSWRKATPSAYVRTLTSLNKGLGKGFPFTEEQIEVVKNLRRFIFENRDVPYFETTITDKTVGKLLTKNKYSGLDKIFNVKENVENKVDGKYSIVIAENSSFFKGYSNNDYLNRTLVPGAAYILLPSNNDKLFPSILRNRTLSESEVGLIISAVKSFINNEEISGIKVNTLEELQQVISPFIFVGNDLDYRDDYRFTLAVNSRNELMLNFGKKGIYRQGKINFSQVEPKIVNWLKTKQHRVLADKLVSNLEDYTHSVYLFNQEENKFELKKYNNYLDFLLERKVLLSNIDPIVKGKRTIFMVNPMIKFDTNVKSNEVQDKIDKKVVDTNINQPIQQSDIISVDTKTKTPKRVKKDAPIDVKGLSDNTDKDILYNLFFDRTDLKYYKISDLTLSEQNDIVNTISYNIINWIKQGFNPQDSFNLVYNQLIEEVEKEDALESRIQLLDLILDNWESNEEFTGFVNSVLFKLSSIGIDIKDNSVDYEDQILEKRDFSENSVWKVNLKDKASARIKSFLSFIPKIDEEGNYETNIIGTAKYYDLSQIYDEIKVRLTDVLPDNMYEALVNLANDDAKFVKVLDMYNKSSQSFKNEFMSHFRQRYSDHTAILFKNTPSSTLLTPVNANLNNLKSAISNDWYNSFKLSQVIYEGENGELLINQDLANTILHNLSLFKSQSDDFISDLSDAFNRIGVELTVTDLSNLNEYIKLSRKIKYKDLFEYYQKEGKRIFTELVRTIDGKLDNNNPFTNQSGRIGFLASFKSRSITNLRTDSFTNANGDTVYSYNLPTYLTDTVLKLKTDSRFLDNLYNTSFAKDSHWLEKLRTDDNFRELFEVSYFDSIKTPRSKKSGKSYDDLDATGRAAVRLSLFQNSGNDVAKFISLAFSDKKVTAVISAPKEIVRFDYNNDNDVKFSLDDDLLNILAKGIFGEIKRIISVEDQINDEIFKDKIKGYHTDGKIGTKFLLFPFFNNDNVIHKDGKISNYIKEFGLNDDLFKYIKDKINENLSFQIEDKINKWEELGIIEGYNKIAKLTYFDGSYINKIKKYIAEKGYDFNNGIIRYAAVDYVVNYNIALTNAIQLLHGDPALAAKKDVQSTIINYFKRLAKDVAPGSVKFTNSSTIRTIQLQDVEVDSDLKGLTVLDVIKEGFKGIVATDAQELTTVKEHINVMYGGGEITDTEYEMLNSIIEEGKNYTIPDYIIDKVMNVMKPVYVGDKFHNNIRDTFYIKSSSYPLLPNIIKGSNLDKLRRLMEKHGVNRVAFSSAIKLGLREKSVSLYKDGKFNENLEEDIVNNIIEIPRDGFKIQQDNPYKNTNEIHIVTQARKNLFRDIAYDVKFGDVSREDLSKEFDSVYAELIEEHFNKFIKEFGIEEIQPGFFSIKDFEKVYTLIKNEAIERDWSINDLAGLELNEAKTGFKFPVSYSNNFNKIEALVVSLIKNNVTNFTISGRSFTQASSIGYEKDLLQADDSLKYMIEDENGLLYSEVDMSWNLRDENGKLLEYEAYVNKDGTPKDNISKDVLYSIGMRIPNSGHNSMMRFKIRKFLPPISGDIALIPAEVLQQMGSDLDFDKLYIYFNNIKESVNNDIKQVDLYEGKDKIKVLENKFIDIHSKVLGNKNISNLVVKPLGLGKLGEVAKELDEKLGLSKSDYSIISDEFSDFMFDSNKNGKILIGKTSTSITSHAMFQEANIYINTPILFYKNGKIIDEDIKDNSVNSYEHEYEQGLFRLDKITNIEGRRISEVLEELQAASTDNAKDPILSKLNLDENTYPYADLLARLGIDVKDIANILLQEAFLDFAKRMSSISSIGKNSSEKEILKELYDKYQKDANITGYDFLDLDYANKALFNKDNSTEYKQLQYSIIRFIIANRNLIDSINNLQSIGALDGFNKPKKSFGNVITKNSKIVNIQNKLLSDRSELLNVHKFLNNKVISKYIQRGIDFSVKLFDNFSNLTRLDSINVITSNLYTKNISEKTYNTVVNEVRTALFTIDGLVFNNLDINYEKKRLLTSEFTRDDDLNRIYSNKSLAVRLNKYKGDNIFLNRLITNISPDGKLDTIEYQGSSVEQKNDSFLNPLNWSEALNDESTKKLAEDLIKYSLLFGGIYGRTSFSKYIPSDWLIENLNPEIDITEYDNIISRQFFQSNPELADRVTYTALKPTEEGLFSIKQLQLDGFPRYISTFRDGKWFSFEQEEIIEDYVTYRALPGIGNNLIYEYDLNNYEAKSILEDNKFKPKARLNISNNGNIIKPKSLYDIKQNASISSKFYLNNLLEFSKNEENSKFIDILKSKNVKSDIVEIVDVNENWLGKWDNVAKKMYLNRRHFNKISEERLAEVVIHETIHKITRDNINLFNNNELPVNTVRSNINDLNELLDKLKSDKNKNLLNKFILSSNDKYAKLKIEAALSSIDELVAYAFTDNTIRKALNQIPYSSNKSFLRKLFTEIINFLRNIGIEINKKSALEEVLYKGASLITLSENNKIDIKDVSEIENNFDELYPNYKNLPENIKEYLKADLITNNASITC